MVRGQSQPSTKRNQLLHLLSTESGADVASIKAAFFGSLLGPVGDCREHAPLAGFSLVAGRGQTTSSNEDLRMSVTLISGRRT